MIEKDLMQLEKVNLNNVPCLLIKPRGTERSLPTLIHYHGWSSRKENHTFLAATIARYGYQVILPDSILHGERDSLEEYSSENLKKHFWDVTTNSIKEFENLFQEAIQLKHVDEKRMAISGSSMGGFIASSIFARNDKMKALINYNGANAWQKAEEVIVRTSGPDMAKVVDKKELLRLDPISYKDNLYPRPILMLHGDADTSIPIEIQRYFYREVAPYYKEEPNKIRLEEYRNLNHHISIKMVESTVNFLRKFLT